jgi:hypothetical protein
MTSPSDPGVNGIPKVQHDDMPQEGHDEQFGHANSGSSESVDAEEKEHAKHDEEVDEKADEEEEEE